MNESREVLNERIYRIFQSWIEFYKTRYVETFTAEYMKELEGHLIKLFESGDDAEIQDCLKYMLTTVIGTVLKSLDDNVRAAITGVISSRAGEAEDGGGK